MRKPVSTWMIGAGLVGAHALLAAAAAIVINTVIRGPGGANETLYVTVLAVFISQGALIGLWAGLGQSPIAWRLPASIGGGAAVYMTLSMACLAERGAGAGSAEDWIFPAAFVLAPLVAVGLLATAMRRRKFAVERLAPGEGRGERRDAQFSLFHLFAITFVAAILFTLVRQLRAVSNAGPTPWHLCLFAAFNALVSALHTQICVWSALCTGRFAARLAALLSSTALAAAVYGLAAGGRPNDYLTMVALMSAYSIVTAGSLLVLRRFGYRLTRQAPPAIEVRES